MAKKIGFGLNISYSAVFFLLKLCKTSLAFPEKFLDFFFHYKDTANYFKYLLAFVIIWKILSIAT